MQYLRRIPATNQNNTTFPRLMNRPYSYFTPNCRRLASNISAIYRLNRAYFLCPIGNNCATSALCIQHRGLTFEKNPPEKERTDADDTAKTKDFEYFRKKDEKAERDKGFGKMTTIFSLAYLGVFALGILYWLTKDKWSADSRKFSLSKSQHESESYLSSIRSVPFEDSIEKLLKSGKVVRIIHFPLHNKAVAVLHPGAIIDGVEVKDRAIALNLRGNHLLIHPDSFANEIRRLETDIGIEPGHGVLIEHMQYLRRIPATNQNNTTFQRLTNRPYSYFIPNCRRLASNISGIDRRNRAYFLCPTGNNCATSAFCIQQRGLRTKKPNENQKVGSSSDDISKTIRKAGIETHDEDFEYFRNKAEKVGRGKEFENMARKVNVAYFALGAFALGFLYWVMKDTRSSGPPRIYGRKSHHEYSSYVSGRSVPYEDFIEKLLKSGEVARIIHFPLSKKAVAVLHPGAIIDGVEVKDRAIALNLRGNHLLIHPDSFANEIRRLETDIGIEPGHGVLIEVVNKT
ncbi:hypothetical protein DdX_15140 [Ditylenchus destructor]|uniref:Uncharacterized protein n=1 Tax=Ditylenchus destructor TaxID=166010 RepID=A0AAD4MQZ7_9BILA|nr:hypothetical protein DdX_15140 [Ditylenchus destructor]